VNSIRPSVLVVDDSADSRDLLMRYLAFRKFRRTAEACNGLDAIERARLSLPDVVLMDLSMATMDGWEATRRLKADPLTRHIVVVALTAHAFEREHCVARAAGCDAIVTKPYRLSELADALERVMIDGVAAFADLDAPRRSGSPSSQNGRGW
jgi:two-component system, cell cycle response regulator DivK